MKKRNFPGFVGAKTIGFSERHFDLVVQALDHVSRNRFFGPEIMMVLVATVTAAKAGQRVMDALAD